MIIANDATVKAGAFFPMTAKKVIRAQTIALENHLPVLYLVDSAGIFLPLQDEVFPDQDDFGRVFYLNARMSALGIPQIAAIMGSCVAGGAYLPVMCDTLLMTDGSGLYLAGPALVKAAIGQSISSEDLGGATVHAAISGTVDFHEKDDASCIARIREVVGRMGSPDKAPYSRIAQRRPGLRPRGPLRSHPRQSAWGSTTCGKSSPGWWTGASSPSSAPSTGGPWSAGTPASAAGPWASWPTRRST